MPKETKKTEQKTTRCYAGTSGFSYKEWHGSFYPSDLPESERLSFYASQLGAVEINNTFYRLPKRDQLRSWTEQTPNEFRFVIKAPRRITHQKRLLNAEEPMGYLTKNVAVMGERLGAVLFQLPPNMRMQLERLKSFVALIPKEIPVAFEFRHESWRDDKVFELLRSINAAWVLGDEQLTESDTELPVTADWSYLRMRQGSYNSDQIQLLAGLVETLPIYSIFAFFKHEADGAPALAQGLSGHFVQDSKLQSTTV